MLTELEQRADAEARHAHRELVEAYEAKLAKAVEALENIAYGGAYTDMQIARTTLAELKGRPKPMTDTTPEAVERLQGHVEWLRGDHDRCNPWLADTIDALLRERDEALARIKGLEDRVAELQWDVLRLEAKLND